MKVVLMSKHDFNKVNLVTISGKKGDLYKCQECGAQGYRCGLAPMVELTEAEFKKAENCSFASRVTKTIDLRPRLQEIETGEMPYIGIKAGVHKCVSCPIKYAQFAGDAWVFSDERQEPVRLLRGGYKVIK